MKLIDCIEPGAVRLDVSLVTRSLVEQIEGLIQIRSKPDELIADIDTFVIAMGRNLSAAFVINDQYSSGCLKRKLAHKFH